MNGGYTSVPFIRLRGVDRINFIFTSLEYIFKHTHTHTRVVRQGRCIFWHSMVC